MARGPPQGTHAKGTVPGPHTRTPAQTTSGQRTLNSCPGGGRPGDGEPLTPGASHNGTRQLPRRRPPAAPTARNASPKELTLRGRCCAPTLAPPAPWKQGRRCLAASPQDGRPREEKRLTLEAPHNGERSAFPRDDPPPPLLGGNPCRAHATKGQCWAPDYHGTGHPPRGHPPAIPTAHKTGSLWDRWAETPTSAAPGI